MLQRRTWQFILAILFGVQSSLTLVWILLIPGEESSAVFLGLSPSRLVLVLIPLGLLLFSIGCIVLLLSRSTYWKDGLGI